MLRHEFGVPVVDVFLMQVDGTSEAALDELAWVLSINDALGQRTVQALVVFPAETLHVKGSDARPDQVGLNRP